MKRVSVTQYRGIYSLVLKPNATSHGVVVVRAYIMKFIRMANVLFL